MQRNINSLNESLVNATDGEIGRVKDVYFDDAAWAVRYLVVETGTWLARRKVLISPYSLVVPIVDGRAIDVSLTRAQVKGSPTIDTHKPVSRQHERAHLSYYGHPEYWSGSGLWGDQPCPAASSVAPRLFEREELSDLLANPDDSHLRSAARVTGYHVQAADGGIGHVDDFIVDDASWAIRYLSVDTHNWWPGGKKVFVATGWIGRIDWTTRKVHTVLTRCAVKEAGMESSAHGATDHEAALDHALTETFPASDPIACTPKSVTELKALGRRSK